MFSFSGLTVQFQRTNCSVWPDLLFRSTRNIQTPEGLACRRCGRCEIGAHIDELENLGYMVWIAPGSTLIKRMVKKYRPEGIIGVGCLMEVKEGLELTDKMSIVGMGVLTATDGCVETAMNWNDLLEVALLSSPE